MVNCELGVEVHHELRLVSMTSRVQTSCALEQNRKEHLASNDPGAWPHTLACGTASLGQTFR